MCREGQSTGHGGAEAQADQEKDAGQFGRGQSRGEEGHRVFSVPALVAPYAGTMTAVYAWYPSRYEPADALRMGNYTLLGSIGGNIALEFFYSGPHSLLSRMHLNNGHGAPPPGSNP